MKIEKINWEYFEERPKEKQIKHLIIHSFAYPVDRIIGIWKDFGVSPHYLIDENGHITQFVSEDKVAYHAGKSFWNGEESLNFSSVGIELYTPSFGQNPYPVVQINALKELAKDIIERYNILPENVVGHSDVAPTRKVDPGRAFPWKDFAEENIGLWTKNDAPDTLKDENTVDLLSIIGYDVNNERAALLAFLRHFMPEKVACEDDAIHMEDTLKDRIESCSEPDEKIKIFLAKTAYTYRTERISKCIQCKQQKQEMKNQNTWTR